MEFTNNVIKCRNCGITRKPSIRPVYGVDIPVWKCTRCCTIRRSSIASYMGVHTSRHELPDGEYYARDYEVAARIILKENRE